MTKQVARNRWLTGLTGLLLVGCASTSLQTSSIQSPMSLGSSEFISAVGVDPKTIDLSRKEAVTVRYTLAEAANVHIDFVDEEGFVTRQLKPGLQQAGRQSVVWDGQDDNGQPSGSGVYRYVIFALDNQQQYRIHDPSFMTGGEELKPTNFTYDRNTGLIRWLMPKAGFARLRVGVEGFPHLRTLMDWSALEAGAKTISWEGLDASGLIKLSDHEHLSIKLTAFSLPDNTIILHGKPMVYGKGKGTYPALANPKAAYLHAKHLRQACHEAQVRLEFPKVQRWDDKGNPVVSGTVPVRVVLDEKDAATFVNSRFEIALFEDASFLTEVESGTTPFTYLWDTSHLSSGLHLLTANILSYDDHYAVTTVPVLLEPVPQN